jgi:DNA-binding response OmpR family regulator
MLNENAPQAGDSSNAPLQRNSKSSYHILLVDDDFYLRELHAEVLIRSGYNVNTAADGAAAWNALNDVGYDLLITDNNMPILTGLGLIKKLRSNGFLLPIILASGTVPMEELSQNSGLRIDATLQKPFSTYELLITVKNILFAIDKVPKQSLPSPRVG